MIAKASNDEPLPVYGQGLNVRDWLYVEDHCRILAVLEKVKLVKFTILAGIMKSQYRDSEDNS